ncbi:hypothetical protein ACNSOL_00225 [Aliarcobacter lanthieri]|uniref:hypothetical protein n=1 Tax=Aliarcobacter lanthieri TaxID=1355374 RepID=UPI003AAB14FB
MHFDTNNKKCDICDARMFNKMSFSPTLNICSKDCLEELFRVCKKIKIKKKHLRELLFKPKYKTRQLKKRIAKKNQISKKILSFEIETRKFDIQNYSNKHKGEENVL